LAGLIGRGEIR